jgi:hypothetical protein
MLARKLSCSTEQTLAQSSINSALSSKQVHQRHPDQLHSWKGTPVLAAKLPKFIQHVSKVCVANVATACITDICGAPLFSVRNNDSRPTKSKALQFRNACLAQNESRRT